jgi:hypothetical protein
MAVYNFAAVAALDGFDNAKMSCSFNVLSIFIY